MTRSALEQFNREIAALMGRPARPKKTAAELAERNRSKSALARAKRLAQANGVDIEREGPGAYWVTYPPLLDDPTDPLAGNHFCTDGQEVAQAVEAYVEFLSQP